MSCRGTVSPRAYRTGVDNETLSVIERMRRAGIAEERVFAYFQAGAVVVDGERVSEPDTPAPFPARIVLLPA